MAQIHQPHAPGVRDAGPLARLLRPAVGFNHPTDVLKDPDLDAHQRRAILSSWASDANAVPSNHTLRIAPGSEKPVPLLDILAALSRLDN
jgi:hypothetical protein